MIADITNLLFYSVFRGEFLQIRLAPLKSQDISSEVFFAYICDLFVSKLTHRSFAAYTNVLFNSLWNASIQGCF